MNFTCHSSYEHDGLKVTLQCDQNTIEDVLSAFENVLYGAGFRFKGHLEIVEDENGS